MVHQRSVSGDKFELVDRESGRRVESALIFELTDKGQMASGVWNYGYPQVTNVASYSFGNKVILHRGHAGTVGIVGRETNTYGLIVIAQGFAPKLFFTGPYKIKDRLTWTLRPIPEEVSLKIFRDLKEQLSSPDDEFLSVVGEWDHSYAWKTDKEEKTDPVGRKVSAGWKLDITPEDRKEAIVYLESVLQQ